MATTVTRSELEEPTDRTTRMETAAGAVSDTAEAVKGAAVEMTSRLPDAAAATRVAFEDANRRIQAGSDEMLTIGTAVSFGFAVGLLMGGANRTLVAAAFVPVGMMGFTLLDRSSAGRTSAAGRKEPAGL